jgi:acyl-coenzyme A synthetase/AMP-(fatty) acid ligase/acyl carrier protein
MLQFASLSFDASFHEIFSAWAGGGTLYIANEVMRHEPEMLCHYLSSQPINRVILPVAVLQVWAEQYSQRPENYEHLQQVIVTGEQLHLTRPIVHLFEQLPGCNLHNHYGPSETHVVIAYRFTGPAETWNTYAPIGRPIANTQIYILDQLQQPVPIGVSGEIYIGGAGVARGYLNQPALTAEKFIADPFNSGGRLYRTGDLGKYLLDGNLEFVGRIDNQVKLRGFRIELGEVEAALSEYPQVQQSFVLVQGESADDKRLVAYVVGEEVSVTALREYLQTKLPEYMVPSFFMFLEEMPLTPNGKIDRKALPELQITRTDIPFTAPRNPAEEVIAQMWAEVLSVEQVSIHDNFFELGGHSLLATKLISRVRQTFDLELPLRYLFEKQTVAGIVEVMANLMGGQAVVNEISQLRQEIEQLSVEEVHSLLAELQRED